ncbi:MAG TPA: hypothetical protein VHM70_17025, partial [Polyangiaceae bacterium]|nr:hypothetical protein [Polyangiaceae bacterium]
RARTHDALSGEVIDSIVGVVTGRDGLWQLQAAPFKERITQRFTHELETDLCADGRNSMCNRGQFNPAGRALAMGALGGTLDTLQPYLVDGLLASLPIVGPSRAAFFALRESLVIAPAIFSVLGCFVLLFSWRLRTAALMFGCCCLFAGLALFGLSWTTHWVATLAGISEEVWQLAAAQTGASSGLGSDDYGLMASGAALLLGRIFGPGWRRKFWERRLTSSDPGLAALASKRLSKPAGLREPAHVLGALVSRN